MSEAQTLLSRKAMLDAKKQREKEDQEAAEADSYAEDKARAAEIYEVTRNPKTVLHTTYRGRR